MYWFYIPNFSTKIVTLRTVGSFTQTAATYKNDINIIANTYQYNEQNRGMGYKIQTSMGFR